MWELSTPAWELIIRACVIFLTLFLMFKVWGRKHLGQMAPFDFVLLLIMSEAVQNSLVDDDKSIPGGLIVVATFMSLASLLNILAFYSRKAETWLDGTPKLIIRRGQLFEDVLKQQRISRQEVEESIREQGVERIEDVGLGVLETNGQISIIRQSDIH